MRPGQEEDNSRHAYVASTMKVSAERLIQACDSSLARTIPTSEVHSLFEFMGIGMPTPLTYEFSENPSFVKAEEMEARDMLIRASAFGLAAQVKAGKLSYLACRELVESGITEPDAQESLVSILYVQQSQDEFYAENDGAAIKTARKAIKHAYNSGNQSMILSARGNEATLLSEVGRYEEAIKKAKALWKMLEESPEDPYANNARVRHDALVVWRVGLMKTGALNAAAAVQQKMHDLGYSEETGEEYKERVKRDFPHLFK